MASTPPPPRRIHTPPTPLHGPRYDNYEPYSPRRSTRVAAQHSKSAATPSPRFSLSPLKNSASTPPDTIRNTRTRRSEHTSTFSPPSSTPNSPAAKRVGASKRARVSPVPVSEDSDTDILPEKSAVLQHRRTSSKDTFGMLSTPAKTPSHKRKDVNGTARLLFGDNEGLLAPTPRKQRGSTRSRMDLFGGLGDDVDGNVGNGSGIQIYTDSKERVPSIGEDEEANPFLSRNASKKMRATKTKRRSSAEEAARNEEGMVYVFRGKKIFRKYDDTAAPASASRNSTPTKNTEGPAVDDSDNLSDMELRRKAGSRANTRLTRSSLKPRLLFPSESQRREREEEADADEEALTDIEMPRPAAATPTKRGSSGKDKAEMVTPPTTVRSRKSVAIIEPAEQLQHELQDAVAAAETKATTTTRRRGIFDGFQRKKAGVGLVGGATGKGLKREGSPGLNGEGSGKRVRSAVAASSTSS